MIEGAPTEPAEAMPSPSPLDRLPMRSLERRDGPLYRQLADLLREPILRGSFPVGSELPKEAELADRFGVSLITVRQALRDLEADGLIKKRAAKPAVVAARNPTVTLSWNFSRFTDMAAFTRNAELRIRSWRKERSPCLERHFGLGKNEAGYCLRSVLHAEGQPKAQVTTWFPPDIGARLQRRDFDDVLIFRAVERHLGISMAVAHVTVRAEVADERVAEDLRIAVGAPVLAVEMVYQSADQRNLEFSVARHPADLFSITYDVTE